MENKRKVPKIYDCRKTQTISCKTSSHTEENYDPRSICQNVLSSPPKICKKTVCRKFLRTNEERTKGEVVCIPRAPCKIKRHFGPPRPDEDEDEDELFFRMYGSQLGLILNEGTVSETDILKGRFVGRDAEYVSRDGRYGGRGLDEERREGTPGPGGFQTKFGLVQDEETAKVLEELSKYLDPEEMAAVAALGGSDICPCCECLLCKCKLRGITSETLVLARKKALIERRLKQWGGKGYAWSFDYFYNPDLESFELERQQRIDDERVIAEERENALLIEEISKEIVLPTSEETEKFLEEMGLLTEEGVQVEPVLEDEGVQAEPELLRRRSLKPKPEEKSLLHEEEEVRKPEKEEDEEKEEESKGGEQSEDDWIQYKVNEWASISYQDKPSVLQSEKQSKVSTSDKDQTASYVRSSKRSSIESWVETRRPTIGGRRPTTILDASLEPIDIEFPEAEIRASVRLIESSQEDIDAPVRIFDRSQEETRAGVRIIDRTRRGVVQKSPASSEGSSIASSIRLVTAGWADQKRKSTKLKKQKGRSTTPSLAGTLRDRKSLASKTVSLRDEEETILKSSIRSEKDTESKASKTVSMKVEEDAVSEMTMVSEISRTSTEELVDENIVAKVAKLTTRSRTTPERKYTDVCSCLPGFCTCGTEHYIFKQTPELIHVATDVKPEESEKAVQSTIEEESIEEEREEVSEKSSCICYHPWDDMEEVVKITPAPSMHIDYIPPPIVPKKLLHIRQPRYQKTLIIVKPEAMAYKDVIVSSIKREGLDIIHERLIRLSPEQVSEIYSENQGSAYFPLFVQRMSSTPILALCVAGIYVIDRWKRLTGQGDVIPASWFYPDSVKRRFGLQGDIYEAMRASNDFSSSKNEINYFFPLDILDPIVIDSMEVQDYCDQYIHPTLLTALFKVIEEHPKDPLMFLAEWLLKNNPYQPHYSNSSIALAPI
ncbi:hypothetical protein HHI36_019313 [Cryptolaemus montrouzieri]|uniref:Nucleoside diphosphate kinase-like domain-containing protein n=1 Tax=Cryptolaemus montrouzieri TaxID=559131 RepID=A0ABD2P2I1_9CUCU